MQRTGCLLVILYSLLIAWFWGFWMHTTLWHRSGPFRTAQSLCCACRLGVQSSGSLHWEVVFCIMSSPSPSHILGEFADCFCLRAYITSVLSMSTIAGPTGKCMNIRAFKEIAKLFCSLFSIPTTIPAVSVTHLACRIVPNSCHQVRLSFSLTSVLWWRFQVAQVECSSMFSSVYLAHFLRCPPATPYFGLSLNLQWSWGWWPFSSDGITDVCHRACEEHSSMPLGFTSQPPLTLRVLCKVYMVVLLFLFFSYESFLLYSVPTPFPEQIHT